MFDIASLRAIFGGDIIAGDEKTLAKFSHDQVGDERYWQKPAAVVFPNCTAQVSELMKWANATGTPVTPRGAGSGLAGAAIAAEGGVVCAFEKMNRILDIDTDNLMVTVQPGVITNALDEALKPHGLFFAGYPMSEDICFIGGNVAENAGGGRAVKYGTTSAYLLGAEVVSPTGDILRLGGKRLKDVTGYNLLQLMAGSEGTLGLFTEIILRVIPRPQTRGLVFASFQNAAAAARCVADLKKALPDTPSSIEFIDGETTLRTNASLPPTQRLELPATGDAYLLVEFESGSSGAAGRGADADGGLAALGPILRAAEALIKTHEGSVFESSADTGVMERVWKLRKQVAWWIKRSAGQWHSLEDVVVPPAAVAGLVAYCGELRVRFGLPVAVFGHAGDGNFHVTPMKAENMQVEVWDSVSQELLENLYRKVVELGGTISGEHGIGRKRGRYMRIALNAETIAVMRAIKKILDPRNILNPGVALPED